MSNRKLIIIGASGQGKVCADIALKMNKWDEIAFLDDNPQIKSVLGLEVVGNTKDAIKHVDKCDFLLELKIMKRGKKFKRN